MTCSGRYAEAADYDGLLCAGIDLTDAGEVARVNAYLDIAASDVHAALAAVGACSCPLEGWAVEFVKKLNIIDAAVIHSCPCGNRMSDDRKRDLLEWLERQYELIREGKIPLCQGDTGANYPAFGVGQMSYTPWNEEQILTNERLRRS